MRNRRTRAIRAFSFTRNCRTPTVSSNSTGSTCPRTKSGTCHRSRPQQPVFRLDQRDLVRREADRFIAFDEITIPVQFPPKIFVFRAKLTRRDFHPPGGDVFAAAEIQLSRRIDGVNFPHREMHGKSMHLIFRMDDARDMLCCVLPRQKLHESDYSQPAAGRPHTWAKPCGEKDSPGSQSSDWQFA